MIEVGDTLGMLFTIMLIPLGLWKLFEIIIWFFSHLAWV